MKFKNYIKVLSLSLCLTIATTAVAFADTSTDSVLTNLDKPVSNSPIEVKVDEKIYNKQVEIDKILFKDGSSVLEGKKIFITHTGLVNDYIEIGIDPFNEENANMIYDLVGKDLVKVVEGTFVLTLEGSLAADGSPEAKTEINTTVATEAQVVSIAKDSVKEKNSIYPLIIGVAIVALLGGILVFMKKIKSA